MSRITALACTLACFGLAACSIPQTDFHATPDAAPGVDAMLDPKVRRWDGVVPLSEEFKEYFGDLAEVPTAV